MEKVCQNNLKAILRDRWGAAEYCPTDEILLVLGMDRKRFLEIYEGSAEFDLKEASNICLVFDIDIIHLLHKWPPMSQRAKLTEVKLNDIRRVRRKYAKGSRILKYNIHGEL